MISFVKKFQQQQQLEEKKGKWAEGAFQFDAVVCLSFGLILLHCIEIAKCSLLLSRLESATLLEDKRRAIADLKTMVKAQPDMVLLLLLCGC